jgi:hypothetical protein|tara:strand:- start:42 stop:290 length:249 start_codon:yes stop_codon:yes gene_type:complete
MKNLNLPTAETLAQHVTWTGLSLIELVNADRISPVKAAEDSIIRIQQEAVNAGNLPSIDQLQEVSLAYEKLECELLDLLIGA